MSYRRWVAQCLASAFKAGNISKAELIARGAKTLGDEPQWLVVLVKELIHQSGLDVDSIKSTELTQYILANASFQQATRFPASKVAIRYVYFETANLPEDDSPINRFQLPLITTEGDLARWLNLGINDLLWLKANFRRATSQQSRKSDHYHYQWISKRNGRYRLLEAPKGLLKRVQMQIYQQMLKPIPQPECVQGFVGGRSIVSHAQLHVGQSLLLKFDLQDFFPSVSYRQVYLQFSALGYPHPVAKTLVALCTHQTPQYVTKNQWANDVEADLNLYNRRHLPQGAPTSPVLANLAAKHLDKRLSGLAEKLGCRYSRYADDIVMSGPPLKTGAIHRLQAKVGSIALEEGFALNMRKNRAIKQSQRQSVCSIVVNRKTNINRNEIDAFKALLFNCIRYGPESQNRTSEPDFRAHLKGKLAYYQAVNSQKSHKLLALFEQIDWRV